MKFNQKSDNGVAKPAELRWPGKILLEEFMQPLGLAAYRVAKEVGVAPITISEILRGLRAISPRMACRLGAYFDVSPFFWLAVQAQSDARRAAGNGSSDGVTRCSLLNGQKLISDETRMMIAAWEQGLGAELAESEQELPAPSRPNHSKKRSDKRTRGASGKAVTP